MQFFSLLNYINIYIFIILEVRFSWTPSYIKSLKNDCFFKDISSVKNKFADKINQ